jgi:hypothetical protein
MGVDMEGFGEDEGDKNNRKEVCAVGCPGAVEMGLRGSGDFEGDYGRRFKLSAQTLGKTPLQLPGRFHDMYRKKECVKSCKNVAPELTRGWKFFQPWM